MDIGFIGLGNMGAPMARRLIEAGHSLVVYDTRNDASRRSSRSARNLCPRRRTLPIAWRP